MRRALRAAQKQFRLLLFWEQNRSDPVFFCSDLLQQVTHHACIGRSQVLLAEVVAIPGIISSHTQLQRLFIILTMVYWLFAMPLNASHHLLFIPQACLPPPGAPPPTRSQASSLRRNMSRSWPRQWFCGECEKSFYRHQGYNVQCIVSTSTGTLLMAM